MARDPEEISETMRLAADTIENYSDQIGKFMEAMGLEQDVEQPADMPEPDKLAEVYEEGDSIMVISEIDPGHTAYGIEKIDDEVYIYAGDETVSATVESDLDMGKVDMIVQNGVIRVTIPTEEEEEDV